MAVNVDAVYKTVLLILNKEQRGYITPDEFNKVAAQVQIEIFNKYFDDLNQLLKSKQTDLNYADRVSLLDEKLSIFKSEVTLNATVGLFNIPTAVREIGSVVYNGNEVQRLQKNEFYNINKSDLTKPSENYPVYLYENNSMKIYPSTITSNIIVNFIRQIVNPVWGFIIGPRGQYIYDPGVYVPGGPQTPSTGSINFELHSSEQTNIITRILMYSGIIIQNPEIIQVAAAQVQNEQVNSKL
jgi:hypothetical protein